MSAFVGVRFGFHLTALRQCLLQKLRGIRILWIERERRSILSDRFGQSPQEMKTDREVVMAEGARWFAPNYESIMFDCLFHSVRLEQHVAEVCLCIRVFRLCLQRSFKMVDRC